MPMSEIRQLRLLLHKIALELADAEDWAAREFQRRRFDLRAPKSPFTHRTSRDLWTQAHTAKAKLRLARVGVHTADAALRHLDNDQPHLSHLKRVTSKSERARTRKLLTEVAGG